MKKWMNKFVFFACLCLTAILGTACSGSTEDAVDTGITLTANKSTLNADGNDKATFTVVRNGADITADAEIRNVTTGDVLTNKTFSTTQEGTSVFEASYDGAVSNRVSVVAIKSQVGPSKFARNIAVLEFTGTWCAICPTGMTRLNYLIDSSYKGVIELMSVHQSNSDPMEIPESSLLVNKFSITTFPSCVADMRDKAILTESYSVLRKLFDESLEDYGAHCGVAIRSEYAQATGQAKVTVRVTSDTNADYRLAVYVLEDGLNYQQNDGGTYRDYTHNHVMRRMLSETIEGDKLGAVGVGKEVSKEYTVTLDKTWKPENVSFYAMAIDANGYANNVAVCEAVNGDTDYEYVKD